MFLWILLFCVWILPSQSQSLSTTNLADSFGVPTLLLDNLQLTLSSKLLFDVFSPTSQTLKGYLGWIPKTKNINYTSCSGDELPTEAICLRYGKNMKLTITQDNADKCENESMTCHAVSCHKIHWEDHIGGTMDCFLIGEDFWYGGGEIIPQNWPLQNCDRSWYPAVTGDPLQHPSGNIAENLWISSGGFAIFVEHATPLFVSFNETGSGNLCFTSSKKYPYQSDLRKKSELSYTICSATSIKEVYTFSLHRWFQKPFDIPNETLFKYPIWSTWARYKQHIDENTVLKFASEIVEYGLPGSQLEIDDKWEDCYGNLEFDYNKFPNPQSMTSKLKDLGFATSLWVHPFCNFNCKMFETGKNKDYWVKDKDGDILNVTWWNGNGAVLDTTNEKARQWFIKRLQKLQHFGIESFKFDAGEILWFDSTFNFNNVNTNLEPNIYSQFYAEMAAKFGNRVEVRTGYNTQHLPIMVRVFDKYSNWDHANGLQSLIPTILHLTLLGYYFILPDMVGGNNYELNHNSFPDRELYIRWLQVSTFMPFIQFSITPWDFDSEVISITQKMLSLREKYSSQMLNVAHQTTISGHPIIRPIWWIAPDDVEAFQTDSEFLLGDGILVAPIVTKGAKSRDIYLPEGIWEDVQKGKIYEGSIWLFDYKAPLNFLPFFVRQPS